MCVVNVTVVYVGLIKQQVDSSEEILQLPSGATGREFVAALVTRHGDAIRDFLCDDAGEVADVAAIFVDGAAVRSLDAPVTGAGATIEVVVMSPRVAGG
jgi:hypothetical protein